MRGVRVPYEGEEEAASTPVDTMIRADGELSPVHMADSCLKNILPGSVVYGKTNIDLGNGHISDQWNTYRQSQLITSYEDTLAEMEPEDYTREWEAPALHFQSKPPLIL